MRIISALILAAALAGCAASAPRPVEVTLDRTLLEVRLSNGQTCLGPAPDAVDAGWSGTLQGCAVAWPYTVDIDTRTNPVRFVLQEIFTAIGLADALAPVATVTLTDDAGRLRRFASPAVAEQ
jgi:opacity protein-like surface antigen